MHLGQPNSLVSVYLLQWADCAIEESSTHTDLSDLGMIVIKVYRVKDTGRLLAAKTFKPPSESKVNEKAKKALLTHSVRYTSY
jgi:hypothetical protein